MDNFIEDCIKRTIKQAEDIVKKTSQEQRPSFLSDYDLVNPYREKREAVAKATAMKYAQNGVSVSLIENYVFMNLTLPTTYEMVEEIDYFTLAMALYMLDHIPSISEVHKLVAGCDIDDIEMPPIMPLDHDLEDIKAVMYLIHHRNDDLGGSDRILLNKYSLEKKVPEVPSRARFHALMDLVGQRDEARHYYEKKREEWMQIFFKAISSFDDSIEGFKEKNINEFYDNCFDPLPEYDFFSDFLEPNLSYASKEERKKQALESHRSLLMLPKIFSQTQKATIFAANMKAIQEGEAADIMKSYQVEDGYLLAYGLLVLLDERDESLFDYGTNVNILERASELFPWNCNDEISKIVEKPAHDYFTKVYDYQGNHYPISSLLYDSINALLPGTIRTVKTKVRLRAKDQGFMDGFHTALGLISHQEQESDDHQLAEELVHTQHMNKKLRQEIDQLKRESHNFFSKTSDYQEQYNQIKQEYETLKEETAKLREIIFNQEIEDIPEEKMNISFPYTLKEKTLVYGGHESWIKNLKTMFAGDIEFMRPGQRPPYDYLLNFDVLWLQTNSIGHDDYFYLIDIVRRYHLNLRYFTMRGVKACAKELVEYEEG